ncbi:MAG: SBBP repeat-containing protein [Acidobacteria bacterium]|nr:SBBP repeat-containing protein [Acidobacteriota bacterium]
MKKALLLIHLLWVTALVFSRPCPASDHRFPFALGGTGQAYGKAVATDPQGNLIVAALFDTALDADPGPGETRLASSGGIDILLVKYTPSGELRWAKVLGGAQSVDAPHGVSTDDEGNIYLTGYFGMEGQAGRTADFDPGPGSLTLTAVGGFDAFLAKYDPDGGVLWALPLGNSLGQTEERGWDLSVDHQGNVFVTGAFSGNMNSNPLGEPRIVSCPGAGVGLFVGKYSPGGLNLWAKGIGANLQDVFSEGYAAVSATADGGCLLGGNYRETVCLDPPQDLRCLTSRGGVDIFAARYEPDGSCRWAISLGGTSRDLLSPGALRNTASGGFLVTGHFTGNCDFDPGPATHELACLGTADDVFVGAYSESGSLARVFSIPCDGGISGGHRIQEDPQGGIVVAGWFSGKADFAPGSALRELSSQGGGGAADAFLARYTPAGELSWVGGFGAAVQGGDKLSIAAGLSVDARGNAFITGKFYGSGADFDPSPSTAPLTATGAYSAFVSAYASSGSLGPALEPTRGDLDGDGMVTASDAVLLAFLLAGGSLDPVSAGAADLQGDKRVDALDLVLLNLLLSE